MPGLTATELLSLVLDPGSWEPWDEPIMARDVPASYAAELAEARERTGCDESVITGAGTLRGRRVAVAAGEYGFLAGTIGLDAAARLIKAVERATAERLPLLAATVSGGTRMQEGTAAFVRMVGISAAIAAHRAAGLVYLVYLRNPTTGGVFASWGSLGHVTVAEPGALVGFLGPRVYEALYGEPFPAGVQRAENLYRHGIVDAVLPPEQLADITDRALRVLCAPRRGLSPAGPLPPEPVAAPDVWASIERSRRSERPGVRRLLRHAAADVVPLNGTGEGESAPGLILALARFGAVPAVVLGQDRRGQIETPLGPEALRAARRGMRLAHELALPLVTVIDTPGAALSQRAEEGGLAGEIARCLAELATLTAPTLCVLLGPGTGGGALALLPADRVICAEHAWLSPLPPEGAAVIIHRTIDRAPEMAERQGVSSAALRAQRIVDRIVPELPDAADEPAEFLARLATVLEHELAALLARDDDERLAARAARFRADGA